MVFISSFVPVPLRKGHRGLEWKCSLYRFFCIIDYLYWSFGFHRLLCNRSKSDFLLNYPIIFESIIVLFIVSSQRKQGSSLSLFFSTTVILSKTYKFTDSEGDSMTKKLLKIFCENTNAADYENLSPINSNFCSIVYHINNFCFRWFVLSQYFF